MKNDEIHITYTTNIHYLFQSIVNSSDDGIVSKVLDGNIKDWNKGGEKTFITVQKGYW